ncbi:MAG: hypothetical protein Q4F02_00175 [Candidatus Saccharibacteria bacterium]|nr:hypothetical protein [Candidatus Saccharibacteria bacterium]
MTEYPGVRLEGAVETDRQPGAMSASKLAQWLGVSPKLVRQAVDSLGLSGHPWQYGGREVRVYSPDEQVQIEAHLRETEHLLPRAPEGYLPVTRIADTLGLSSVHPVNDAVVALGLEGKLCRSAGGKTGGRKTRYYSPAQQAMIREYLTAGERSPGVSAEAALGAEAVQLVAHRPMRS